MRSFWRPSPSLLCKPYSGLPLHRYLPPYLTTPRLIFPPCFFCVSRCPDSVRVGCMKSATCLVQWRKSFLPDVGGEACKHFLCYRQPGLPTLVSYGSFQNASLQSHILAFPWAGRDVLPVLRDCILFPMILELTPATRINMQSPACSAKSYATGNWQSLEAAQTHPVTWTLWDGTQNQATGLRKQHRVEASTVPSFPRILSLSSCSRDTCLPTQTNTQCTHTQTGVYFFFTTFFSYLPLTQS